MNVFAMPSQTFSSPCGHSTEPVRKMMYVENSAPKSITSDARNSQTPSLPLCRPVSGRASTVYGIFMLGALRLELRGEIGCGARHAVFVRAAVDDRLGQEVPVSWRRR